MTYPKSSLLCYLINAILYFLFLNDLEEIGWITSFLTQNHESSSEDEDQNIIDEQYKDFLFAPDDIPNFVAKPKENLFGIGYKGLDRGSNVLGHVNLFGPGTR